MAAGAKIGQDVVLGEDVRVDFGAVIYGPARIGAGSYLGPNTIVGFPMQQDISLSGRKAVASVLERTLVGSGAVIRPGTAIYRGSILGDRVRTGHNVLVREKVKVGDDTLLGTGTIIDDRCTIGKHVSIQSGVYLCTNSTVEDFAFLGPFCVFTNDKYLMRKRIDLLGPIVREEASVGANALLMPAVEVGRGAVVGAHALVTENVPPQTIVAGVPAVVRRKVPDDWTSLLREKCLTAGCHK